MTFFFVERFHTEDGEKTNHRARNGKMSERKIE